jgi:hypothetical protein
MQLSLSGIRKSSERLRMVLAFIAISCAFVSAQDIPLNVTYICSGERMYVENCNIRDLSDNANCMVGHPDKILPNGINAYTYVTRGALKKLLPSCQQPTAKQMAAAKAMQQRQQDAYNAAVAKANPPQPAPSSQPASQAGANYAMPTPPKNAEERAMRRCVSSGRPSTTCTGNSLLGMFGQMVSHVLPGANKEPEPGPNMAGVFQGAGNWRLDFIDNGVLVSCKLLSPNQQDYTLDLKNGRATLTIATTPRPLVLAVHADDAITGPGPVTIDGVIAAGYSPGTTNATQHDIYGNEYDAVGNRATTTPGYTNFAPKRVTCPAINLTSKGAGVGIQTMQTDLLKTAFGGDEGPPTPTGIRMHGIFAASTGFSVQFFPESAILGCGPDAARAYPYTVAANGTNAVVKIDAPDRPLTLAFRPDGSLDPGVSDVYQVHGRIVVGQNDDGDFAFAPLEQTCALAVLAPSKQIPMSGGAMSGTGAMVASAGSSGAVSGAGTLSTPGAPLGNATLSVYPQLVALPGAPNPFAGHPYVLLRASYADSLAQGGVTVPPGVSPYIYSASACANRTPDCQKISDAIKASAASAVRADANGRGTLPGVPPGTYYLMISTRYNNQPYAWGQAVQLKTGTNSITLDLSNATPIK